MGCEQHQGGPLEEHSAKKGIKSEYSGQFYTVIPEVGNRRSDVKETVIPEPWKPWFLPL